MVSALVSGERQTHRADGSGGDAGRDCYLSHDDGTDVYELTLIILSVKARHPHAPAATMQSAPGYRTGYRYHLMAHALYPGGFKVDSGQQR